MKVSLAETPQMSDSRLATTGMHSLQRFQSVSKITGEKLVNSLQIGKANFMVSIHFVHNASTDYRLLIQKLSLFKAQSK